MQAETSAHAREPLSSAVRAQWKFVAGFTLFAATCIAIMVPLGLWQLRRLDWRKAQNAQVRASLTAEPVGLESATLGHAPSSEETLSDYLTYGLKQWSVVSAKGEYLADEQIVIKNRSQSDLNGFHVLTPLRLNDGRVLLVNRGFVAENQTVARPPTGSVEVVGRIRPTQTRGWIGPRDPATGHLDEMVRVDVKRIAAQLGNDSGGVFPFYLELTRQPPGATTPTLIPPPELDNGPHLGYAIQWFSFSIAAGVGWWLILRRKLKRPREFAE